jgi:hypothetical protein
MVATETETIHEQPRSGLIAQFKEVAIFHSFTPLKELYRIKAKGHKQALVGQCIPIVMLLFCLNDIWTGGNKPMDLMVGG